MRLVNLNEEKKVEEVAKKAAESFKNNKVFTTFTDAEIEPGVLFAVRWIDKGVLVFRLDECFEPVNYQGIIK